MRDTNCGKDMTTPKPSRDSGVISKSLAWLWEQCYIEISNISSWLQCVFPPQKIRPSENVAGFPYALRGWLSCVKPKELRRKLASRHCSSTGDLKISTKTSGWWVCFHGFYMPFFLKYILNRWLLGFLNRHQWSRDLLTWWTSLSFFLLFLSDVGSGKSCFSPGVVVFCLLHWRKLNKSSSNIIILPTFTTINIIIYGILSLMTYPHSHRVFLITESVLKCNNLSNLLGCVSRNSPCLIGFHATLTSDFGDSLQLLLGDVRLLPKNSSMAISNRSIETFLNLMIEFPQIFAMFDYGVECFVTLLAVFLGKCFVLVWVQHNATSLVRQRTCPKPKMQVYWYVVYMFDHPHASGNRFEDYQFDMLQKKVGQETHLLQQMQWQLPMSWKGPDGFRWNLELVERYRGLTKTLGKANPNWS